MKNNYFNETSAREILAGEIIAKMAMDGHKFDKEGLQNTTVLKKAGYPVSWGVLYNIVKNHQLPAPKSTIKLLKFFGYRINIEKC